MDPLLSTLASDGLLGVITAIALIALYRKDREVTALYQRLEDRSDKLVEKYHALGKELTEILRTVTETMQHQAKRKRSRHEDPDPDTLDD